MPGWSDGICWAPEVSQVAVRVTVMAPGPARSESSHRLTFPLEMSAPPMLQPDGSAAMQGSMAADGTAWALRIIEWPVPQLGAEAPRFPTGTDGLHADEHGDDGDGEHPGGQGDPPDAPALQGDRRPLRGEGAEFAEQVARVAFHERAQLGRAGDPAGGGERFGELVGGEVGQRPPVDALRVGADREDQHHVAQVDRLPPR